jgi:hypothetical protein
MTKKYFSFHQISLWYQKTQKQFLLNPNSLKCAQKMFKKSDWQKTKEKKCTKKTQRRLSHSWAPLTINW